MSTYDLIIIGAGPGGYVAAIRAAQLGLNVACVDKNAQLGGTCLRVGCIPSKAMLESSHLYEQAAHELDAHGIKVKGVSLDVPAMVKRKDKVVATLSGGIAALFKKNKITHYQGVGSINPDKTVRVVKESGDTETLSAKHILIATGSRPATLPGVDLSMDRVDTSTDALSYDKPPKHLAVIGAGYIGLEIGSVWRRLGSKVTVLEYLDRVLPGMDGDLARHALKVFQKQGLNFELKSRVTGVKSDKQGVTIERDGAEPVKADRVLVAVGRAPFTEGLGVEELGIERDDRGFIVVDKDYQTSVKGVYAIGDVIPTPMLAHVAEEEGIACVEKIVTGYGHVNYKVIPAVVFTHPEIASVGKSESELKDEAHEYKKGVFHFKGNGRAHAIEQADGFVKIVSDKKTDRVLGIHIIGPDAGALIAECATAMEYGATAEDIYRTCHAHPTLSEAVKEAALAVDGRAIHG
ncbi:MAG: dihydrolipoyl dehydrogenase [Phycisphaeraceae bacterium]